MTDPDWAPANPDTDCPLCDPDVAYAGRPCAEHREAE